MKKKKLFNQIAVTSIFIFFVGLLFLMIIMYRDHTSESNELNNQLKSSVNNALSTMLLTNAETLGNLNTIHSYWTDFQDKILEKDIEWIESNATSYLIEDEGFRIDMMYFFDERSNYSELHGGIPIEVYESILESTPTNSFKNNFMSYLVIYQDTLNVLTASYITDSNKNNPSGVYFLGRRVDQRMRDTLQTYFDSRAKISFVVNSEEAFKFIPFNNETLMDVLPEYLSVNISEIDAIKNNMRSTTRHIMIDFFVGSFAVALLLVYFSYISNAINKGIKHIKYLTYKDYTRRIHLNVSEEFNELGTCINTLAKGLETRDKELRKKYIEIISILTKTLEETDIYTKGHSERVSHYAVELATAFGYPDINQIRVSGLLHDIGKISIRSEVLNKAGKLTDKEYEEVKKHPEIAYKILEVSEVFKMTKDIVRYHHEKFDGTGYPKSLKGEEIPLGARIISIVDVFDALTSKRSYRNPLSVEEALKIIIKDSGTHFDPQLVAVFSNIVYSMYDKWSDLDHSPDITELM